jgi:mRNA-degrading endonuclease RelE of RelBE toxin-antitoxin system
MQLHIHRRAEISLRSLGKSEQMRIHRALAELTAAAPSLLYQSPKLHRLSAGISAKKLYAYRVSPKLRLILSLEADECTVEDVVDHDRLDRLFPNRRRQ